MRNDVRTDGHDEPPAFRALGRSAAVVVMRAARGAGEDRPTAAGALVAGVAAVARRTGRVRSPEHGEEARPPVWHELLGEAIGGRGRAFVFLTTYLTFLFVSV